MRRQDLIQGFRLLGDLVNFLAGWKGQILPYDIESELIYKSFPPRIRQELKNDARIAAVALRNNAKVWTLNLADDSRVPDLDVIDARTGLKVL